MHTDKPEIKEALLYTKYSLFITIISLPFGLMGYLLNDSGSFAIDVMAYAFVGFFIGLLSLLIWQLKLKKLRRNL